MYLNKNLFKFQVFNYNFKYVKKKKKKKKKIIKMYIYKFNEISFLISILS